MGREELRRCVSITRARLRLCGGSDTPRHSLETSLGAKSLPEMTFGSELTLTHAGSGVQLAFTAADALREWKVCQQLADASRVLSRSV
jgi:hypothetical protein